MAYLNSQKAVVVHPPCFSMYGIMAGEFNAPVLEVPLTEKEFNLDMPLMEAAINDEKSAVTVITYPNNPTGQLFKREDVEKLIKCAKGIVIVDEAYFEFAGDTFIDKINEYKNLIVMRTFSKAYGMAGLRIGIGAASTEIATLMNTIKGPYNVNSLSQKIALRELNDEKVFKENLEQILAEREFLKVQLNQLNFVKKIYPTEANFFLIKVENPIEIYEFLLAQNILTSLRHPQIENALRINVGSKKENQKLIETWKNYKK